MRRKRRSVTFRLIPSGGRYQVGYLNVGEAFGSPDTGTPNGTEVAWLGPYLINIDRGEIVPYLERKAHIDKFIQGIPLVGVTPQTAREKPFIHNFAEGTLTESDGTIKETWQEENLCEVFDPKTNEFRTGSYTIESTRVYTRDVEGNSLGYIEVYQPGGYMPTYRIYGGIPLTVTTRMYVGEKLVSSGDSVGGGILGLAWEVSGDEILEAASGRLDEIEQVTPCEDGFYVRTMGEFDLYQDGRHVIDHSREEYLLPIVFVSPVYNMPVDDGTRLHERMEAAKARTYGILQSLSSDVPRDAYFYALVDAIDGFQACTINGIAFVKDLSELKSFLDPVIGLIKNPTSLKKWSQLLLWWRYGVKCSWRDWLELIGAIQHVRKVAKSARLYAKYKNSTKTRYGKFSEPISSINYEGKAVSNARVVARLEVPVEETTLGGLRAMMEDMDFRITLHNLWDLVPYSFVIDWFVNVDEFLSNVDFLNWVRSMTVRDYVHSQKNTATTTKDTYYDLGFSGQVSLVTYERNVSTVLPSPPGRFGGPSYSRHSWELAEIFLSKKG